MQHLLTNILGQIQKIRQWRIARYDRALLQLELHYRKIDQAGKATARQALEAAAKILKAYIFLPDFYYIVTGLTLMVFAANLFVGPGESSGFPAPFLFLVSGSFAALVPMLLGFLTLPPHVLLKANLWVLTFLNVAFSALVFSYLEPSIAASIVGDRALTFERLLWPMFVFYFFAEFYMLMRINPAISYTKYIERHAQNSIAQFIPANKLGPVLSLSAQDHYVAIATPKGAHLERMTMKKAVGLMPDDAGMQVHRSHWVAYMAILDLEQTGERYAVLLRNGRKLPVGKSKVQDLKDHLENR